MNRPISISTNLDNTPQNPTSTSPALPIRLIESSTIPPPTEDLSVAYVFSNNSPKINRAISSSNAFAKRLKNPMRNAASRRTDSPLSAVYLSKHAIDLDIQISLLTELIPQLHDCICQIAIFIVYQKYIIHILLPILGIISSKRIW